MPSPLLPRVVEVERLIKLPANTTEDEFLGIARLGNRNADLIEPLLGSHRIELAAEELFERVEVDRKRIQPTSNQTPDLIASGNPVGKARQVGEQLSVVGPEIV